MTSLSIELSRTLAAAVVTAAALAGCANPGCRARCSTASSACSGKKCGACAAKKKCGACGAKKCSPCAAKKCGACAAKK